jgi:hypothetical protein
MEMGDNKKTEDYLGAISFKTAPPGLKEKILDGIHQRQTSNHVMSTFLWKGFAGCLILLFIVIAVDATITQAQNRRFSSFVDIRQESTGHGEEEWSMLREIVWEPLDSTKNIVRNRFYGTHKNTEKKGRHTEWRESLEKEIE